MLSALFTTSCDEIMSNLDQPVSSYLELKTTTAAIAPGKTYQIEASTISTSTIDYESSNPNVAIVDPSGKITALEDGEATITVKVAANENYLAGSAQFNVKVQSPLTLEAKADGKINVYFNGVTLEEPIVYTIVGGKSKSITANEAIDVKKGQKVQFESKNDHLATGPWNYVLISPDVQCAVYGNVMSLITPEGDFNSNTTITKNWAFSHLFYWSYNIVNHDKYKLVLPATTLSENCYYGMFQNSALSEAPELPAENMESSCYSDMFAGCTSLTKAPALPAKKLASYCYNYMFGGCTSLTEAPELKAETLADNCYNNMFNGCSKLNKVVCLATTNATDALCYWLYGAGTDASVTKRTLVRAESNKKWTNNDGWTWGKANWYVPTSWTIEPEFLKSIVLVPGVWDLDDARFAAYVWKGSENKWYLFSKTNDKWTATIPSTYTGLVLVRLNNGTEVNWDSKWNQTSDIDFTNVADNSTISITGWGGPGNKDPYTITAP